MLNVTCLTPTVPSSEIRDSDRGTDRYDYNDPNDPLLRTKVTDAMGYVTGYAYDQQGNLTGETLPSGDQVEYFHYTEWGQPQLIKNAAGHYRLNLYDGKGNQTDQVTFKAGFGASVEPVSFRPEANAQHILSWQRFEYDAQGRLTLQRQVSDFALPNSSPATHYDYSGSSTAPSAITYSGDTDGDGSVAQGEGLGTYSFQYDALGRMIEGVNAALYPVRYQYDAAGRRISASGVYGGTEHTTYDASGLPIEQSLIASVNGKLGLSDRNTTHYDLANRPVTKTDASGAQSRFVYDAAGNLVKATSPDGFSVYFEYDGKNRVTRAYDEEGHSVKRTLDLVGRVRTLTDPNGHVTHYDYYGPRENGRLKRVTDAEGRYTEFEYNATGQVIRVIDKGGRETLTDYDALGRAVRILSPVYLDSQLGSVRPVTTYRYNSLGHQTAVYAGYTDAAGNAASDQLSLQASYTYDDYGRLLQDCNAASQCTRYTYDVHGNALTVTTPEGQVTEMTYGEGGLLISQTTRGSAGQTPESIDYQYNALGQPLEIASRALTYRYQYDAAHRLQQVTDSRGNKSVGYDYSLGGLLNQITDSDGNNTRYLYDPTGRLTGVRTADQGLVSYIYDAGGRLQQKTFPNDLTTAYRYFKDNKVEQVELRQGDQLISRFNYQYNDSGDTRWIERLLPRRNQDHGVRVRRRGTPD